ncbi:MAG: tetratricopeptide repeat protein [Chitinophagales bacterium]|nr:tetratricopeptide repeat protein [Chitinophagales bacterium]
MPSKNEFDNLVKKVQEDIKKQNDQNVLAALPDSEIEKLLSKDLKKASELYTYRGMANNNLGLHDNAVHDLLLATKYNHKSSKAFNNLGNAYNYQSKFKQAITHYNRAIALCKTTKDTLELSKAYNNIAIAYDNLKQYKSALKNYNLAIKLNPHIPGFYNNRGVTHRNTGKLQDAITDYKKAIELYKVSVDYTNDGLPYSNLGVAYHTTGDLDNAIEAFTEALKIDPENSIFQEQLNIAKAEHGEKVELEQLQETSPVFIEKIVSHLLEQKAIDTRMAKNVRIYSARINNTLNQIRALIAYTEEKDVAHYTKLDVADIIAMNKDAKLRYSNEVFMNDPQEGKVFLNFINDTDIACAFESGKLGDDNNVYLGSFLPEENSDYLVMWRTYGKNKDNEEATGCSLVLSHDFFDKTISPLESSLVPNTKSATSPTTDNQVLYRVVYIDPFTNKLSPDPKQTDLVPTLDGLLHTLKSQLSDIVKLKTKKSHVLLNHSIDKIIYRYVSEVRYFFKSAEYQFERELRIVKYYLPEQDVVKVNPVNNPLPRTVYVESNKPVVPHLKKIILGPKVQHPKRWLSLEVQLKQQSYDVNIYQSECRFQ